MKLRPIPVFISALLLNFAHCMGQLSWEKTEIETPLLLGQPQAVVKFPFKNAGSYPISIAKVETSCACTTAKADKAVYQPGDSGVVEAIYAVGAANGIQNEKIAVSTDDKAVPVSTLTMKVNLPEVLKLTPATLTWKVGEPLEPKTILVDIVADREMNVTSVLFTPQARRFHGRFYAKLKVLVPHKQCLVTIVPDSTSAPMEDVVTIVTDFPPHQPRRSFAVAQVKPEDEPGK